MTASSETRPSVTIAEPTRMGTPPGAEPARIGTPSVAARGPRFITPSTALAVVLVTAAGVLNGLTPPGPAPSTARTAALIAFAALHAALGTLSLHRVERLGSRALLAAHFALAVAVAVAAMIASRGWGFLLILSLVSQAVLYLRPGAAAVVTIGCSLAGLGAFAANHVPAGETLPFVIGSASSVAFVVAFSRIVIRQRRTQAEVERLAAELAEANERLRAHAGEVEELATTRERNRIAREIHDGLGHFLTVVHVQLDAAQATLATDPARAQRAIARAQELTHDGLDEVRRSVSVLRGSTRGATAAASIVGAIEKLAGECAEDGLSVEVERSGEARPLPDAVAFTLYRAAQEAITNIRRHAHASRVRIQLAFADPGRVRLRVVDDGVGADQPAGGFGLVGLRERAEQCGGTLSISAARGQGFALELELPG